MNALLRPTALVGLILLLPLGTLAQDPAAERADDLAEFSVAAVQFSVNEELYTKPGAFRREVERLVADAVKVHDADLVVFPEYINVFLLARDLVGPLGRADSIDEALRELAKIRPGFSGLPDLLESTAAGVTSAAFRMWREIAVAYDVAIVPGTFFVPEGQELRNRLLVLDADGRVVYQQDKVFLTEEEDELLGLSPGSVAAAQTVELEGVELGLTICRDSYFDAWEPVLGKSDIWIDLRANGEPYSQQVRARFDGALPERVEETEARGGLSATLTGTFLDLLWEGPAFAVDGEGRRVGESPDPLGSSLVILTYDTEEDEMTVEVAP
ncbi:MAG: nitrilase-related carbon-nitrogen hydrolase [Spirochaetota bacterium]